MIRHFIIVFCSMVFSIKSFGHPLLGEWRGEFTNSSSIYSYSLLIKIDKIQSDTFFGHIRYQLPNKKFAAYSMIGKIYGADSLIFQEGYIPDSTSLSSIDLANFSSKLFQGKILAMLNGYIINGVWANASGTKDDAGSYLELATCKMGFFKIQRNETPNELLKNYIVNQITAWNKQRSGESTGDYQKRMKDSTSTAQDAFATDFCKSCLRMRGANPIYDESSLAFNLSIDGCDVFQMAIPEDEAKCFEMLCNDISVNKKLKVHWDDVTQKAIVSCFQFDDNNSKNNTPCSGKIYRYGSCQ